MQLYSALLSKQTQEWGITQNWPLQPCKLQVQFTWFHNSPTYSTNNDCCHASSPQSSRVSSAVGWSPALLSTHLEWTPHAQCSGVHRGLSTVLHSPATPSQWQGEMMGRLWATPLKVHRTPVFMTSLFQHQLWCTKSPLQLSIQLAPPCVLLSSHLRVNKVSETKWIRFFFLGDQSAINYFYPAKFHTTVIWSYFVFYLISYAAVRMKIKRTNIFQQWNFHTCFIYDMGSIQN